VARRPVPRLVRSAAPGTRREIIATAARTNSNKAAGPVARVFRDLVMPMAMKRLAKPEKAAWQFGYRIDCDAPVAGSPDRAPAPA
jgi:FAD-dependent urate hydroxylase